MQHDAIILWKHAIPNLDLKPAFLVGYNLQTHELPKELMIGAWIPKSLIPKPPLVMILAQFHLLPIFIIYLLNKNLNVILPPPFQSQKWPFFKAVPHQNSIHIPCSSCLGYIPSPSLSLYFPSYNIKWPVQIREFLIMYSSKLHTYIIPLRSIYLVSTSFSYTRSLHSPEVKENI